MMQTKNAMLGWFRPENAQKIGIILAIFLPMLLVPMLRALSALVLLFFANAAFSYFTLTIRRYSFGIELTTLITVAAAFSFGPIWGGVFGLFMILAEYIGTMRVSILSLATIPAVILMGIVSPSFSGLGIASAGLILSISYNIITFFACFAIRRRVIGLIIFAITNIVWNKFLFSAVSLIM